MTKEVSVEELIAAGTPDSPKPIHCEICGVRGDDYEFQDWDDLIRCEQCSKRVCNDCKKPRSCYVFCVSCDEQELILLKTQVIASMARLMADIMAGKITGQDVAVRLSSLADTVNDFDIK